VQIVSFDVVAPRYRGTIHAVSAEKETKRKPKNHGLGAEGRPADDLESTMSTASWAGDALCPYIERAQPYIIAYLAFPNSSRRSPWYLDISQRKQTLRFEVDIVRSVIPPPSTQGWSTGAAVNSCLKKNPSERLQSRQVCAAALTVCRAYVVAGRPVQVPPWGVVGRLEQTRLLGAD